MNATTILIGFFFGLLGAAYLMYGKRRALFSFIICGLMLMIIPYFIHGILFIIISLFLLIIPFFFR